MIEEPSSAQIWQTTRTRQLAKRTASELRDLIDYTDQIGSTKNFSAGSGSGNSVEVNVSGLPSGYPVHTENFIIHGSAPIPRVFGSGMSSTILTNGSSAANSADINDCASMGADSEYLYYWFWPDMYEPVGHPPANARLTGDVYGISLNLYAGSGSNSNWPFPFMVVRVNRSDGSIYDIRKVIYPSEITAGRASTANAIFLGPQLKNSPEAATARFNPHCIMRRVTDGFIGVLLNITTPHDREYLFSVSDDMIMTVHATNTPERALPPIIPDGDVTYLYRHSIGLTAYSTADFSRLPNLDVPDLDLQWPARDIDPPDDINYLVPDSVEQTFFVSEHRFWAMTAPNIFRAMNLSDGSDAGFRWYFVTSTIDSAAADNMWLDGNLLFLNDRTSTFFAYKFPGKSAVISKTVPLISWVYPPSEIRYQFKVVLDSSGNWPSRYASFSVSFVSSPRSSGAKSFDLSNSDGTESSEFGISDSGVITPRGGRISPGHYTLTVTGRLAATDRYAAASSEVAVLITVDAAAGDLVAPSWVGEPFGGSIVAGTAGPHVVGSVRASGADTYRFGSGVSGDDWTIDATSGEISYVGAGLAASPSTIALPVEAVRHVGSRTAESETTFTVSVTAESGGVTPARYHAPTRNSDWNPGTGWVKDSQGRWTITLTANRSGVKAIDFSENGGAWNVSSAAPLQGDDLSYIAHPSPASGVANSVVNNSIVRVDPVAAGVFTLSVSLYDGTTTTSPIVFVVTYTAPSAQTTTLQWFKADGDKGASEVTTVDVTVPELAAESSYFGAAVDGIYLDVSGGVQNRPITLSKPSGGRYFRATLGGTETVVLSAAAGGGSRLMRRVNFYFAGTLLDYETGTSFSASVEASAAAWDSGSNSYAAADATLAFRGTVTDVHEPPVWSPTWSWPYAIDNTWQFPEGSSGISFDIGLAARSPEGRTLTWLLTSSNDTKFAVTRSGTVITLQPGGTAVNGDSGTVTFQPTDGITAGESRTLSWQIGARELIVCEIAFSTPAITSTIDENALVGSVIANIAGYATSSNQQVVYGSMSLQIASTSTVLAEYCELDNIEQPRPGFIRGQLKWKKSPDYETVTSVAGDIDLAMAASHNAAAGSASQTETITIRNINEPVEASETPLSDVVWNVTRAQALADGYPELLLYPDKTVYFEDPERDTYYVGYSLIPRHAGDAGIVTFRNDGNKVYGTPTQKTDGQQYIELFATQPDHTATRTGLIRVNAYVAAAIANAGGGPAPGQPGLGDHTHTVDIAIDIATLPADITQTVSSDVYSNPDGRPLAWRNLRLDSTDHFTYFRNPQGTLVTSGELDAEGNIPIPLRILSRTTNRQQWEFELYTTDVFPVSSITVIIFTGIVAEADE